MKKFLPVLAIITLLVSVVIPTAAMAADGGTATARGGSGDPKMSLSAFFTVNDGDTVTIESGNYYYVNGGATVTLRMDESAPAALETEIECGNGVTLTIENVNIQNAAMDSYPIVFSGVGNTLILVGDNFVTGGEYSAGIVVEAVTVLTITGEGELTAQGGDDAAGIGGSDDFLYDSNAGQIIIDSTTVRAFGGLNGAGIGGGSDISGPGAGDGGDVDILGDAIVYAMGGDNAYDVGPGDTGSGEGTLLTDDDSVLFAYYSNLPSIIFTSGNHYVQTPALQPVIDLYGPLPTSWGGASDFVIFVGFNVLYEPNGGAGTTQDPGRPYPGGSATAMANGFTRSGYTFAGWNTAPDGSGTGYDPGDTVTVPVEGVRLYAMWEATVNPRTGETGSYGFVFVLIAVITLVLAGYIVRKKVVVSEK